MPLPEQVIEYESNWVADCSDEAETGSYTVLRIVCYICWCSTDRWSSLLLKRRRQYSQLTWDFVVACVLCDRIFHSTFVTRIWAAFQAFDLMQFFPLVMPGIFIGAWRTIPPSGVQGSRVWGQSSPEAETVCRDCLQNLTAEKIKIWKFCSMFHRGGLSDILGP